ncbi:unnamed protein product [Brachionus calyciflorus]|uniref:Reverse transcriptase domain-containing protein n=1 Tax=Brachionus calyciflorus TaxID=104777 RepID=A0A813M6C1_9BILA|nr:unnamed protein product [Brachionus calyciflorus]
MWTLKQAIEIAKQTKSCRYVCSLDESKAFDKVNRTILWWQFIQNMSFKPKTEPLLEIISQTETDIIIDKIKIEIIAYTDNVLLVSSTKSSPQKCLDLITKFGEEYEIQFNPINIHYIVFDFSQNKSTMKDSCLKLSGLNIERLDSIKYLKMQID